MTTYLIKRLADTVFGTFGVMIDENNIPFVLTLERPWMDNQHGISCIPPGTYECHRVITPLHGNCFMVMNVPDRDFILFHKGNIDDDTHGCIIIGEKFEYAIKYDKPGVAASGEGYAEFMNKLAGLDKFTVKIIDNTTVA